VAWEVSKQRLLEIIDDEGKRRKRGPEGSAGDSRE
jgi:hypothetical protein